jgi:hypothetical protein
MEIDPPTELLFTLSSAEATPKVTLTLTCPKKLVDDAAAIVFKVIDEGWYAIIQISILD